MAQLIIITKSSDRRHTHIQTHRHRHTHTLSHSMCSASRPTHPLCSLTFISRNNRGLPILIPEMTHSISQSLFLFFLALSALLLSHSLSPFLSPLAFSLLQPLIRPIKVDFCWATPKPGNYLRRGCLAICFWQPSRTTGQVKNHGSTPPACPNHDRHTVIKRESVSVPPFAQIRALIGTMTHVGTGNPKQHIILSTKQKGPLLHNRICPPILVQFIDSHRFHHLILERY